jgi:hypothetical protein
MKWKDLSVTHPSSHAHSKYLLKKKVKIVKNGKECYMKSGMVIYDYSRLGGLR